MDKRWLIAPVEPAVQQALARELSVPAAIAQVLINRGYCDVASARAFLHPQLRHLSDPFELPDATRNDKTFDKTNTYLESWADVPNPFNEGDDPYGEDTMPHVHVGYRDQKW